MKERLPQGNIWLKPDPEFNFKWKDRNFTPTRIEPLCLLDKKEKLCNHPGTGWLVSGAYQDAIEISASQLRGTGYSSIGAALSLYGSAMFFYALYRSWGDIYAIIMTGIFGIFFLNFAIYFVSLEFVPRLYVLLNKKNRTVSYQLIKSPKFFSPWSKVARPFVTYSWDAAKARIYREHQAVGGTLPRTSHSLWLLWGDEPDHPRHMKACVRLGSLSSFEEPQIRMWEHVRRFMEEGGPHVAHGQTALGGAKRSRFTPPFPADILAAAGPALTPEQIAAVAG